MGQKEKLRKDPKRKREKQNQTNKQTSIGSFLLDISSGHFTITFEPDIPDTLCLISIFDLRVPNISY